jgi:uncharacterized protein with GYD domain
MATFITTVKFTDQGAKNIQETCKRADEFKAAAKKMDIKIRDLFWTLGPFDGLLVFEAPDEETATAAMLHLASQGNVSTQTARAYKAAEMKDVLAKVPPEG